MTSIERDRVFRARMSSEEIAMLRELADKRGVTASDYVRLTIRELYAVTFDGRPPSQTKARKNTHPR